MYAFVVSQRLDHEQREVHAARQVAGEDRIADVSTPHGQALGLAFLEVAAAHCRAGSSVARSMLAAQRRSALLTRLESDGRIVVKDLATELGVTEDSLRRDLRELAAAGLWQRVYGGASGIPGDR